MLPPHYLPLLFQFARAHSQQPERDRCFIALSYYAALRAQEIAFMELRDVTDAAGALSDYIEVSARAAKYGKPRSVPAIGELKDALATYLWKFPIQAGPLFFSQSGQPMTPSGVAQQLARIGRGAGFDVSSHSGRRTCLTLASQKAPFHDASLRDVQMLAGHSDISTTQAYIEPSSRHSALLESLYQPLDREPIDVAPLSILSPQDKGPGSADYFRRRNRFRKPTWTS
jgi:integrase/recombinase XerD